MLARCSALPNTLVILGTAAYILFALTAWSAAQDKKDKQDVKKDDNTKVDALKKDDKQDKKDSKKDDKGKTEPKKQEKKDLRVYPKVEPLLQLKGHGDWVYRVLFTPDGKSLVSSGRDKTVRFWDASAGKEVRLIKDLAAAAAALAISPDGGKVVTTAGKWNKDKKTWTGAINVHDAQTGKLLSTIHGHSEPIEAAAFDPKGAKLATASQDGDAKLWDLAQAKELQHLKGHTKPVLAITYSPDGKWIATGSEDNTVKVWDAAAGSLVQTLEKPERAVGVVAFSPDSKLLAAGSQDGTVTLWDTSDFKEIRVLKADEGVMALAFSPDGAKLATGGWDRVVKIWEIKSGKELGGMAGHAAAISSLIFNSAGDRIVSASLDETIRVWDVASAKQKVEPPQKDEEKKK